MYRLCNVFCRSNHPYVTAVMELSDLLMKRIRYFFVYKCKDCNYVALPEWLMNVSPLLDAYRGRKNILVTKNMQIVSKALNNGLAICLYWASMKNTNDLIKSTEHICNTSKWNSRGQHLSNFQNIINLITKQKHFAHLFQTYPNSS